MSGVRLLSLVVLLSGCGGQETDPCATAPDATGARPTDVEGARFGSSFCAIFEGAGVRCWGDNDAGGLAPVTSYGDLQLEEPTVIQGVGCVARLTLAGSVVCSLADDGVLRCWGDDSFGAVGNGSIVVAGGTPQSVRGIGKVTSVVGFGIGVSAQPDRGGVMAWGFIDDIRADHPVYVAQAPWRMYRHALFSHGGCVVDLERRLSCWGEQLADLGAPALPMHTMTDVSGIPIVAEDVQAGYQYACALGSDGSLFCWGRNSEGQLGIGTLSAATAPTRVLALPPVVQVATSSMHTCARDTEGGVWCWGLQAYGEVGPNASSAQMTPVLVPLPRPTVDIALSFFASCALDVDGAIWCWGSNQFGELGRGVRDSGGPEPTQVLW